MIDKLINKTNDIYLIFAGSGSVTLNIWAWADPNKWNIWIALITGVIVCLLALRKFILFLISDTKDVIKWIKSWDKDDLSSKDET